MENVQGTVEPAYSFLSSLETTSLVVEVALVVNTMQAEPQIAAFGFEGWQGNGRKEMPVLGH